MKTLVCLLVLCPLLSKAQHITTDVEYNYLTKEYKTDLVETKGVKPGYRLDKLIWEEPVDNYTFEVSSLIKLDERQVAGILVVAKTKATGNISYICIPFGDQDLLDRYASELSTLETPLLKAYTLFTTIYYSGLIARDKNTELNSKLIK
ncbi:MAG TPA: hypothetical protein DGG95_01235 [Cytophagales bacterium]|jgi:hypothetical protein|nr:hypothetical protein [Cytophagales bacterium]